MAFPSSLLSGHLPGPMNPPDDHLYWAGELLFPPLCQFQTCEIAPSEGIFYPPSAFPPPNGAAPSYVPSSEHCSSPSPRSSAEALSPDSFLDQGMESDCTWDIPQTPNATISSLPLHGSGLPIEPEWMPMQSPNFLHIPERGLADGEQTHFMGMPQNPFAPAGQPQEHQTMDLDAESVSDSAQHQSDEEDGEYTPNQRTRRGHPRNTAAKRTKPRLHKRSGRPARTAAQKCRSSAAQSRDVSELQRHAVARHPRHPRQFKCVFAFAGCKSTFASKNEWKRHTVSQHLGLQYWECILCVEQRQKGTASEARDARDCFNRKDLFMQHLRRMHFRQDVADKHKKDSGLDSRLQQMQKLCQRKGREPPQHAACDVKGCGKTFDGLMAWDRRMEHVGGHIERADSGTPGVAVEQEPEDLLIAWALQQHIIEHATPRTFTLVRSSMPKGRGRTRKSPPVEDDADADGEDE